MQAWVDDTKHETLVTLIAAAWDWRRRRKLINLTTEKELIACFLALQKSFCHNFASPDSTTCKTIEMFPAAGRNRNKSWPGIKKKLMTRGKKSQTRDIKLVVDVCTLNGYKGQAMTCWSGRGKTSRESKPEIVCWLQDFPLSRSRSKKFPRSLVSESSATFLFADWVQISAIAKIFSKCLQSHPLSLFRPLLFSLSSCVKWMLIYDAVHSTMEQFVILFDDSLFFELIICVTGGFFRSVNGLIDERSFRFDCPENAIT